MAYSFNGTSQYLVTANGALSAWPMTFSAWINATTVDATERTILSVANTASDNPLNRISLSGTNTAVCQSRGGDTGTSKAIGTVTVTTGSLFHIAGTISSGGRATVFTNGADKTLDIDPASSMAAVNNTTIGVLRRTADALFFAGSISEPAIWNVVLDDAEIAALAKGYSPALVRKTALVFYAPIVRSLNELRNGWTLTNTATATVADHARVFNPKKRQPYSVASAGGGGGGTVPLFVHQLQQQGIA